MSDTADSAPAPGAFAGHLALVGVQLCFGFFPVFGRTAMESGRGFDPFALAAWRVVGGTVIVGALAWGFYGRRAVPSRAALPRLFGLALAGIVANQALYLSGLARSTAGNAGLMMCTIPVFTFMVAVFLGQERFSPRRACGVALSLLGVLPMVLPMALDGEASLFGEYAVGNLLMAGNCVCYAFYLVLSKPFRRDTPAVVLLFWNYLLALPFVPLFLVGRSPLPVASEADIWLSLAYVVVFPTVVGYLLNVFALGRLRASTTAVYIYLQPVISALGGWWLLEEHLGANAAWAAVGLFLGVWLVTREAAPGPRPSNHATPRSSPE